MPGSMVKTMPFSMGFGVIPGIVDIDADQMADAVDEVFAEGSPWRSLPWAFM
jgi:hypothetical protein